MQMQRRLYPQKYDVQALYKRILIWSAKAKDENAQVKPWSLGKKSPFRNHV